MDIVSQYLSAVSKKSYANSQRVIAAFIAEILQNSTYGSILTSSTQIREAVTGVADKSSKTQPLLHSSQKLVDAFAVSLRKTIPQQQHILSVTHIDEIVLLLAALKLFDAEAHSNLYQPLLKEVLTKQLHRLELKSLPGSDDGGFIGRTKEIEEIKRILARTFRNNVLIIGQTGVGKTTLAQSLPEFIPDRQMYQLFPGSDTFYDQVVSILSQNTSQSILFFLDELFTFDTAHIKYLIDSTQIIGTMNESSYRKFAAEHPHIVSKFEVLTLEEPPKQDMITILKQHQATMSAAYEIPFDEEFTDEMFSLAKQYLPEPAFPSRGISLVDESILLAHAQGAQTVSKDILRAVIAAKTNIPIGSLTEMDKKDLSKLPERIRARVKGQNEAIEKVARTIQRARLGFGRKNRPIGSFLFVGPSGVGKTELAKALAQEVFGDVDAMIRLDMSEFSEAHMVQRLIGAPPGYVGYEEGGQLTNPVMSKPYTLVLLDEIEKAHPRVFDIFLQVLDDGRLTDGMGKKVDFRNTIIIATSNAGIEDILEMIEAEEAQDKIVSEVKEVLQDYFRIEFINRFDDIIIFNPLKPPQLKEIGRLQMAKLEAELKKRNIEFAISDQALEQLAQESYDPRYGARGLLRLIQDRIENKLAEMILEGELEEGTRVEF